MTLHRRSLTGVLLAALIATIALAFGAAARADAAPVQLTNAAQRGNAMEVLGDGTVALRPPSRPRSARSGRRSPSARSASASATSRRTPA